MPALSFLFSLADPRGRCDRKGLLLVAIAMIAAEALAAVAVVAAGIDLDNALLVVLKLACLWLATTVVIKRLHDLGLPGWRMLWVALGVIVWSTILALALMLSLGDAAMEPGALGYNLAVGGTALPVLVLTLWLHVARGDHGANRYGPEPAGWGFSHPVTGAHGRDQHGGLLPAAG